MGLVDQFRKFVKNVTTTFATPTINTSSDPMYTGETVTDFGGTRNTTSKKFAQGDSLPRKAQRELALDDRALANSTIEQLMDILIDAHPDVSYALWNFLRIGNTEYTVKVYKVGNGKEDKAGKKVVDEFIQRLEAPNILQFESSRGVRKVLNQLFISTITRGACAMELVLTQDLASVQFMAPIDPQTVTFKFESDRFVPYQHEDEVKLDIPTFFYEALDEKIDEPYGRSPFLSALNMVLFQMQILNDIRAVVHNQGYPRFDINILEEVLLQRMPIAIRNNEREKAKWLNERLKEIIDMYNNLEVDDTFVHFNSVEIDMVGGGKGGGAMIDPQKLMTVVDNLIMSGLKTLSTILGRRSTGNTESFAKLEIKLYMRGVRAIQEVVERVMSRALTLMLNIQGKQGIVEFRFDPMEIRTDLEQSQFDQTRLQNIAYKRDQGWIDQDEASNEAVGHDSVAEPITNDAVDANQPKNKDGGTKKGAKDEKTD